MSRRLLLFVGVALGAGLLVRAVPASASPGLAPVSIGAKTMRVKGGEQRAVFTGNVIVTRGKDRLSCLRLTVFYDATGAVETFVAEGEVKMVRGARHLRAERAELDNQKNLITLTGDPVMEEGPNVIRGEVMRYDLGTDEIEVKQVKARVEIDRVVTQESPP